MNCSKLNSQKDLIDHIKLQISTHSAHIKISFGYFRMNVLRLSECVMINQTHSVYKYVYILHIHRLDRKFETNFASLFIAFYRLCTKWLWRLGNHIENVHAMNFMGNLLSMAHTIHRDARGMLHKQLRTYMAMDCVQC